LWCTFVHTSIDQYKWDAIKSDANKRKHGVSFAVAAMSLEDPFSLSMPDPDCQEEARFLNLGLDPQGRLLVTVFAYRGSRIRIISSRRASSAERLQYRSIG